MDREHGVAIDADDQRVEVIDIDLGHEEGGEDVAGVDPLSDRKLDAQELGLEDLVPHAVERFLRGVGAVDDHADDGVIRRVEDRDCADVDTALFEDSKNTLQHPDTVLEECRELDDPGARLVVDHLE